MRKPDDLARLRALLTSPEDVEFFIEQLKTADWIPLLAEAGLLADPPAPIEEDGGVRFPFWFASRYLVRVADQDPERVADVLWDARNSPNPRVWWDTVDALVNMPAAQTARFLPFIKRWVHHPWRLSLEVSVGKLVTYLAANGARDTAVDLATDLARLVPPDGWAADEAWLPLDGYDYGVRVPAAARDVAVFGLGAILPFVAELERFLLVRRPPTDGHYADLSFIWRPAIEDHEQNWDHDAESKLVVAIRDGLAVVLERDPNATEPLVARLLGSHWPIVRRLGLHLLIEHGGRVPGLVERALTDRDVLDDEHHRHELYRLLERRFDSLPPGARRTFIDNVHAVAATDAEAAADRHKDDESPIDPVVLRDVLTRRWLSSVASHLDGDDRAELDAIVERLGGHEEHPDFPSYHRSWFGGTSPLSHAELVERDPDELVEFLAKWEEPKRLGPGPSIEGLRAELSSAVAEDPARFATLAPRFPDLRPTYVAGLFYGLRDAIKKEHNFDWAPVLEAGMTVLDKRDENEREYDDDWRGARSALAHLLEDGLEDGPAQIGLDLRDQVWSALSRLAEDPEPTPEDEARFGPPNMDPVTYSLNTTRSAAIHATFLFLIWHHRHTGANEDWSIERQDPAATAVLDRHLDPDADPSIAVRAAYGMRLGSIIDLDRTWAATRAPRIVGRVSTELERGGWLGFLFGARGTMATVELLGPAYAAFAEQLAALTTKPSDRRFPGDIFERFASHLILPWLYNPQARDRIPLQTLLASGQPWLIADVVETAGRMLQGAEPNEISEALATAYRDLWSLVLDGTSNLDAADQKAALGAFAWWSASELPAEWSLRELLALMERDILPNPDFVIFDRLPKLADSHPAETLRVIEIIANHGDEHWSLRTQEANIKQVLSASVDAEDELQRARVQALVNRLVRLGLRGVSSLRRESQPAG